MSDEPGSRRYLVPVSREGGDWALGLPEAEALAERAVAAALTAAAEDPAALAGAEVSILLADDATLRRLNRDYRGQDRPTNVLAFPNMAPNSAPPPGMALALGDLALAWETLRREAAAQNKPLADHFSHLVVHGTLHLLGHDHEAEAEARVMEDLERGILGSLGLPDPYRFVEDNGSPSKREASGAG
ncbi:MAG: rRNA maturation RNase YbeY [Kiloniellales bacterium]|nr:rRNA maturation RNase YbeY [Kiloniellales bacterium]